MRRTEEKRDEGTKKEFNPMCVLYECLVHMTRQDCVVNDGVYEDENK